MDRPVNGNSGASPASSATHASVEESGVTPEVTPDETSPQEGLEQSEAPSDADDSQHERELERDLDELTAKAEKADEYLELAQRTRADFENYRKRAAREAALAQDRGVAKLVKELLPAVDNLDRAVDAIAANGDGEGDVASGLKLVQAELIPGFRRTGVERLPVEG